MTPLGDLAILGAGLAAGTMNAIVGAGSLITFPTLLVLGYSPLIANVSNTVGLVPGVLSGAVGYRRELVGQRRRAAPLIVAALLGGLTGGLAAPRPARQRLRADRAHPDPARLRAGRAPAAAVARTGGATKRRRP